MKVQSKEQSGVIQLAENAVKASGMVNTDILKEEAASAEELRGKLFDELPKGIKQAIHRFNKIVDIINEYEEDLDSLTPYKLAKLEFYYNKAEREAWKIAGYYKSQYQFYSGKSLTERGRYYISLRSGHGSDNRKWNISDANYASRLKEGEILEVAGIYEGYFVTWRGIAQSYQGMQNVIKDMIKAIEREGGG